MFSCLPESSGSALARGTPASAPGAVSYLHSLSSSKQVTSPFSPPPITPHSYSPRVVDRCRAVWITYHKGTPWFVIPVRGIVLLINNMILPNLSFAEILSEGALLAKTKPLIPQPACCLWQELSDRAFPRNTCLWGVSGDHCPEMLFPSEWGMECKIHLQILCQVWGISFFFLLVEMPNISRGYSWFPASAQGYFFLFF